MRVIEKLYSFIILLSVVTGLILGNVTPVQRYADLLIVPLLMGMLYMSFLQIPIGEIKHSLKNVKFASTTVVMNFVWTPLLAGLLAHLFLADSPALWIGFIMLMVTPCTDWYLIFTGIAKGNVPLSVTVLPLNLVLQVILLPFYLFVFGGTIGIIDISVLLESVFLVLLTPLLLAWITKNAFRKNKKAEQKLLSKVEIFPMIFLGLAITAMFASQGYLLLNHLELLWKILIPLGLFFLVNFFVGRLIGTRCQFSYEDKVSFHFTTLARNSPIALAIAMTAFPDQPLIALTLVIGPLLELPILAIITQVLLLLRK